MKVAVVGSRTIERVELRDYLPQGVTEIVSGGARGVDTLARQYVNAQGIVYTEFLPDYRRFGKAAPLLRNKEMVAYADVVIALWDGKSRGTRFVIGWCHKHAIPCSVYYIAQ